MGIVIVEPFNSILGSKCQSSICCTVGHCVRDSQRGKLQNNRLSVLQKHPSKLLLAQFSHSKGKSLADGGCGDDWALLG